MQKMIAAIIFLATSISSASTTNLWRLDVRGVAGPVTQLDLPDAGGKRRTVFIAAEYERLCDPIFSFMEISGNVLGAPTTRFPLKDSKIGIILNGNFYTWHAAKTNYANGFEAALGVPNELLLQLLTNVSSLVYVTPSGENITLPTGNFQKSLQTALEVCRKKVQ